MGRIYPVVRDLVGLGTAFGVRIAQVSREFGQSIARIVDLEGLFAKQVWGGHVLPQEVS